MEIVVYMSPTCPYCRMLKEFLAEKKISYRERDVTSDRTAAQELMKRTGQMGVPVTIIDGQTIVGFDKGRLEQALRQWQQTQRPSFGARIADASKITTQQGLPLTFGAYVGSVRPGSAAERIGLKQGDIVTEINTQHISNASDLENILSRLKPGSRFSLVFLRGNKTLTAEGML